MNDILTFGSATVDIFADTENKLFRKKPRHKSCIEIPFGSKISVDNIHIKTGGGGTNTAACFSSLGFRTAYCGNIGDDIFSSIILKDLKRFRISDKFVKKVKGKSACSIVLDSSGHDRTILTHKAASDTLRPSQVTKSMLEETKAFYCSSLSNNSFSVIKKVVNYAHKNNKPIAFNPSAYLIKKRKKEILDLLPKVTYLILNKEEAESLLGRKAPARELVRTFIKRGSQTVVVTAGKRGAYGGTPDNTVHFQKIIPAPIVETTGAGDSFASACTAALLKHRTLKEALCIGAIQSANIVSHIGAKEKLEGWNSLLKKLKKNLKS